MFTPQERDALEALIDKSSVSQVLYLIADLCHEKADHIRSNWQDAPLARSWEHDARYVNQAGKATQHTR